MIAGLVGLLGFVCSSQAQRNPVYTSLEYFLGTSEAVYVGTVSDLSEPQNVDGDFGSVVTVETTETIKGPQQKTLKLFHYDVAQYKPYAAWKQKQEKCLWFVRKNGDKSPNKGWNALPLDPNGSSRALPVVGYFTFDFHLLTTPKQVLSAARAYAQQNTGIAKVHSLSYMPNLVAKLFPYNTGGEVLVPIVPELEKAAIQMIQSPDKVLPSQKQLPKLSSKEYQRLRTQDEGNLRQVGIQALAKFKSDRNIELVKKYLNDPFIAEYWDNEKNVYSVRKVAYETLTKWDVKVEKPVLLAQQS